MTSLPDCDRRTFSFLRYPPRTHHRFIAMRTALVNPSTGIATLPRLSRLLSKCSRVPARLLRILCRRAGPDATFQTRMRRTQSASAPLNSARRTGRPRKAVRCIRGAQLALILLSVGVGHTATRYVDPRNGNDSSPGTLEQPLRTIKEAVRQVRFEDGGTVFVLAGVYSPTEIGGTVEIRPPSGIGIEVYPSTAPTAAYEEVEVIRSAPSRTPIGSRADCRGTLVEPFRSPPPRAW